MGGKYLIVIILTLSLVVIFWVVKSMDNNVQMERKGLFSFKKKITIDDLANDNIAIKKSVLEFTTLVNERFSELNELISSFSSELNSLKQVREIPIEWENKIKLMKRYSSDLPEISVIYKVLMSYRDLDKHISREKQEAVKANLSNIKKSIDERKIYNCDKCKKAIEEGEYYKVEDKKYCLEHLGNIAVSSEGKT